MNKAKKMKVKKKYLFAFVFVLCSLFSFAQQNKIDSLQQLVTKYRSQNNRPLLAQSLYNLGAEILCTEKTAQALEALENSAEIYRSLADSANYARCLYKISYLYNLTGEYSKSFNYCLHALAIAAADSDQVLEGHCFNLLGRLYYLLNDESSAMEMYEKALQNGKKENNSRLIAEALCYKAIVWRNRDRLKLSMKTQMEALKLREEIADEGECASSYFNIGILYSYLNKNDSCLYWLSKAENIWKNNNDYFNLAECYNYFGKSNIEMNNIAMAENYFNKSLELALKIRAKKMIRYNYYDLAMINSARGNDKDAFKQILLYTEYKDSVIHDQGLLEIARLETKSMKERKDHEIELLNKNNEVKVLQLWFVACCLLLVVILSAFILRSLSTTRQQKLIIEKKQKEILDSIHYAQRIQQSLLTSEKYIDKTLKRLKKN